MKAQIYTGWFDYLLELIFLLIFISQATPAVIYETASVIVCFTFRNYVARYSVESHFGNKNLRMNSHLDISMH